MLRTPCTTTAHWLSAAIVVLMLLPACRCDTVRTKRKGAPRTGIPSYEAARIEEGAILVDGKLDDAGWANAPETDPFVAPGDGAFRPESPVNGAARLAWSTRALYVAVVVDDADPASPFGRDNVDPHVWAEASGIELMLQPGDPGDNRQYFEIQVDTSEAVWDTRFDDYNQPVTGQGANQRFGHQDWDARLERRVTVDHGAGQYTVEMALPWDALGSARVPVPPRPDEVWRINLYTFRDGQKHALAWSPIMGEGNFHRASRFGRVRFR